MDPTQNPVQNTPQPANQPKITLDDLYGPSGLAEQPGEQAINPQQGTQPDAQPVQPVAPAQPVQVVPQVPKAQEQAVPDLPTVQTASAQPVQEIEISPQQSQQTLSSSEIPAMPPSPDLRLRKQIISEDKTADQETKPQAPTGSLPPVGDPKNPTPKKSLNSIFLLRIIFGALAVLVVIGILFFVVTFLSNAFHPTTSGKVTLTFWGLWEDSNTMQSVIGPFEQQHPDISINYEKEDPNDYSQRLLTQIHNGGGPDIFTYHSSWLPMVQSVLVPLPSSVVSKSDLENNFYPVVRTDLVKNGALYGLPLEVDTLSLFVNNTLFQNAKATVPTTWDGFAATARALTQKDANGKITTAGAAMGTFNNITHAPDIISALFVQNGVTIPTLSPQSNAADALTFYTSFATGNSTVWDTTLDPSQLAFEKGNLAMYFGYSWDVFAIKAANPNLDFSIYPIPHLPGRSTTIASYWVEGVSAKSQHQKEAMEFLQYLAQKNTMATLYAEEAKTRLFGEPYARSDLGTTLKSNPLVYPFVEQASSATSSFFAGETEDTGLNGPMNSYLGNAVNSMLNNTSADTAVATLWQGVQQIENQYGGN